MPVGLWQSLTDLVLPVSCAGCGRRHTHLTVEVCALCVRQIEALQPHPARPAPAPAGLPPCFALGEYGAELRELIIGYKERGRHRLARPLGALLAQVVTAAVPGSEPLLLLYIPDTGRAARQRHGDHMRRLAGVASAKLAGIGRSATVLRAMAARAKPDQAGLDTAGRAHAARSGYTTSVFLPLARRAATRRAVVLLDDIMTTGATLAATAELLAEAGLEVRAGVVLAATRRRMPA